MRGVLSFCAVFVVLLAIAPWSCSNAPVPTRQHDWLVFVLDADGKLDRAFVPSGHFEARGDGPPCWMLSAGESSAATEFNWVAPDGHEHPTPFLASRVQVHNGKWEETAIRLGIDLKECK